MTKIPFNFGKEIKKMSKDEDVENNREEQSSNNNSDDGYSNFIADVNKSTIEFHSKQGEIKKKDFQQSIHNYEYYEVVDNILRVRVEFFISKERIAIIKKILDLKYHSSFTDFVEQAIINLVELDLNSPESMVQKFCKDLLETWKPYEGPKRKSLQNPVSD
jgi:hypothetical protein